MYNKVNMEIYIIEWKDLFQQLKIVMWWVFLVDLNMRKWSANTIIVHIDIIVSHLC